MGKTSAPSTNALRFLKAQKADYEVHSYNYEEKGGTSRSSQSLGVEEHTVIKTLIFEDHTKSPMVVLMHGDCEVSTKKLARAIGIKACGPCSPATAEKHSGYRVGGTSPFGLRKPVPIYVERSILALPKIYINGGQRGLLVSLKPCLLKTLLEVVEVDVAIE